MAIPGSNPERETVWSPPYVDFVWLGPIVTDSTPVYDGDVFRGVVGVDISLEQVIERLNNLAPTANGHAFLVDGNGRLVAAPPRALSDLLAISYNTAEPYTITETLELPLDQSPNPSVLAALAQMQQGESGLEQLALDAQPMLLAHTPLPVIGWNLGVVAPLEEITAPSATVAAAIRQDATETVESTLLVIGALFPASALLIAYASRRLITQRVESLAAGSGRGSDEPQAEGLTFFTGQGTIPR